MRRSPAVKHSLCERLPRLRAGFHKQSLPEHAMLVIEFDPSFRCPSRPSDARGKEAEPLSRAGIRCKVAAMYVHNFGESELGVERPRLSFGERPDLGATPRMDAMRRLSSRHNALSLPLHRAMAC